MAEMEPGTEFGGYRIERLLGAGGFCHVYLAEDLRPALRRKVALKVLNPTLSADEKNRERFQRESLLAVELDDHPNIVGVLDAGEQDGRLFIAQRYIEGRDLGKIVEEDGPLTSERAVEVITEIGGALDTAHAAGLVHRDVKPRNILVRDRDQRCFLADFGLTKRTAASDSLTGAGEFLGTFAYAAPEQLGGQPVDGRADLYALGCVLFESLTGSAPFTGDIHTMITSHLTKHPPSLASVRSGLPPAVDAVIAKAMAKEPDDRYQTGAEFAEAARRALLGSGLPPPVVSPPGPSSATTTTTGATTAATFARPAPPAATTPAAASTPPAPPSGGTARDKGSRTPLIVLGVLALLTLVGGGVLLLGGDDDDGPPIPTVDPEAERLEEAQDDAEDAFDDLPPAIADSCELEDVADYDDDVVMEASCDGLERGDGIVGADDLTVTVFDDDGDLADAYDEAQDPAAQDLDTAGDCVEDRFAAHSWTTASDAQGVAGSVACFLDGGQDAGLVWTEDEGLLLGVASRNDDSDGTLYQWWAELVERSEPETVDEFPNASEAELLTHVPAGFRDTCIRADLRPGESASVQCSPDSGAASVFYNQYGGAAAAADQYQDLRDAEGVAPNSGRTNRCPFEGSLTIDDQESGRVFCARQADGDVILVWTNRGLAIQAEATMADGATVRQFWTWWSDAGPIA